MARRVAAPGACTTPDKLNQDIRDVATQPETIGRMHAMHAQPMVASRAEATESIRVASEKLRRSSRA